MIHLPLVVARDDMFVSPPPAQYPSMMKGMNYDPNFAIRGLHCDIKNGLLMKIDTYNHIQPGSVYRCVQNLVNSPPPSPLHLPSTFPSTSPPP